MKLIAYVIDGHRVDLRPAPVERDWMQATDQRFAYRCLPLNIANASGWEILNGCGFTAVWNGGTGLDAIRIEADPGTATSAISHFGGGILTFHVPCLFRTDPGFDLMVQGPVNRPKDAIAPLSGVIETDWASYTFTMNWIFTRPETAARFEAGEPFCHLFPVRRGELEAVEPELRLLSAAREVEEEFERWKNGRSKFNTDLRQPGSEAQTQKWQKTYYRGVGPDGRRSAVDHRTRVRLRPFRWASRQDAKVDPVESG